MWGIVSWQLTIDANDPALLARFWTQALGFSQPVPPTEPETTWHQHYRARLGEEAAFADRLFDLAGLPRRSGSRRCQRTTQVNYQRLPRSASPRRSFEGGP
jgi:hypothetical protein